MNTLNFGMSLIIKENTVARYLRTFQTTVQTNFTCETRRRRLIEVPECRLTGNITWMLETYVAGNDINCPIVIYNRKYL